MGQPADGRGWRRCRRGIGLGVFLPLAVIGIFSGCLPAVAADERPVRLVFSTDIAPLAFTENGAVRGILVDVARDVFAELGVTAESAVFPWERAQMLVQQGEADGFITVATPERRAYAECGHIPVLRTQAHPVVRRDHPGLAGIAAADSLDELKSYAIVSYAGSSWARTRLQAAGFNVYLAADYESHLSGFARGRGDIVFITPTVGAYYMHKLELDDQLVMLPLVIDTFEFVLCLGRNSPHLGTLARFEEVLGRKRVSSDYAAILESYGLDPATPY